MSTEEQLLKKSLLRAGKVIDQLREDNARLRASNAALVEALQKCASWLLDRCDCVDDCGCVPPAARAALADAQKENPTK